MDIRLENLVAGKSGYLRLLPNINRTGRALPDAPSQSDLTANAKVDRELGSRKLTDSEIYSLVIDISDAEAAANPQMTLEATFDPSLFTLLSASGIPLGDQTTQPFTLDLAQARKDGTKARGVQFYVESQTFGGSPLLDPRASRTMAFRILAVDGSALLTRPKLAGGTIRAADLILLGDDAPAERVFICDVGENGPSIVEFTAAAKTADVPVTVVPLSINNGDAWIQDQFQIGYTANGKAAQQVIVHLPRMRSDSAIVPGTANLRNFVDTYFPSDTVGVLKDFWDHPVTVTDGTTTVSLNLAQGYFAFKSIGQTSIVLGKLLNLFSRLDYGAAMAFPIPSKVFERRLAAEALAAKILAQTGGSAEVRLQIGEVRRTLDRLSDLVFLKGPNVGVNLTVDGSTKTLTFTPQTAPALQNFYDTLSNLHASYNYGGNIEVSPPTSDASYGKILVGSVTSDDLKQLLTSRGSTHPVVSVVTTWLEVGHIDEIAAFAPLPPSGFCLLRASPELAIDMLDRVVGQQAAGVAATRMLRGKKWRHESSAKATDPLLPPKTYFELLKSGAYDLKGLKKNFPKGSVVYGDGAYHDDRQFLVANPKAEANERYSAMITCKDAADLLRGSNQAAEDLFLSNSNEYARKKYAEYFNDDDFRKNVFPLRLEIAVNIAFKDIKIFKVPVMFDRVDNWRSDQSSAFAPAMVNFQTLGDTVIVPRPYGPRMHVKDAVAYINALIADLGFPKTKIDEKFVRSRGLDKTWHWTKASEQVARANLQQAPSGFDIVGTPEPGFQMLWLIEHDNDPVKNHPVQEPETLYRIAGYFKDGFDAFKNFPVDFCKGDTEDKHPAADKYETDIKTVMDAIRAANPGAFDKEGKVLSTDSVQIAIPEDTADLFELYVQALMEALGLKVCWVDSWYYHTHKGGIHCGTNALRSFSGS